ncbi:carboxypeptidase-like regulatory domain-containing protein [Neolewinella agarilytica]|uniref:CarboxypepD_reg-like domain-containing protein n=1 Tax=Neolewinella agarilytica TaxID=478744 RepID=A0A1H9L851_9BACT|nr:carboxypeptidase-like regulatory domain-containing protein [Neolewinella agarilytica]SER07409.1 CarboxypepD_reg-like domain-containing protein [Neolewinella agarilytica]
MKYLVLFCVLFFTAAGLRAQQTSLVDQNGEALVQFSGMVLDGTNSQLQPVPYATILITDDGRGTYANLEGFFSIVAHLGDSIVFSALGYDDVTYVIPDTLTEDKYSIVQLMSRNAIDLPETVVFPWPSRDHFKLEFLAMDVSSDLQSRASDNLSVETLEALQQSVPRSGSENASYYLRQQAQKTYYIGQRPPMNIFSPVAWKQFFDGWKRGDFKKKDDR